MRSFLFALLFLTSHVLAEPFTYQGKLDDSGIPATGNFDFSFRLLDIGGAEVARYDAGSVSVENGVFTVEIDFGIVFDGAPYLLEVSVRPTGTVGYVTLSPAQPIRATPEAQVSLTSLSVVPDSIDSVAIVDGSINIADTDGSLQQRVGGSCPTGSSIAGIAADGTVTCETDDTGNDWTLSGNSLSGTEWLGSSNDQPVEIRVNGRRVLRLQHAMDGNLHEPNILAGAEYNEIPATDSTGLPIYGATVAGGGGDPADSTCANNTQTCVNRAAASYATVSGGWANTVTEVYATIGGGWRNTASGVGATVGGGSRNSALGTDSTVGGGYKNSATESATVAGGVENNASGYFSTVGGGHQNTASGLRATVPGGMLNQAGGQYSLAAGYRAKVRDAAATGDTNGDEGTFVWADSTDADFISTGPNQFLVRASGGIWFGNNSSPSIPTGRLINTSTDAYLSTGGTWTNSSDKNRKENFEPVDSEALLAKIATLPIHRWNYRDEDDAVKHVGPTAQDFYAVFGLGQDDKHIATVDADGVALAAIQALLRRVEQLSNRLAEQQQQLARLERQQAEIAQLRGLLQQLLAREGLSTEEAAR